MILIPEFQTITSLIGREDIGQLITEKFTPAQQQEMFETMKVILTDELVFVMSWKENDIRLSVNKDK